MKNILGKVVLMIVGFGLIVAGYFIFNKKKDPKTGANSLITPFDGAKSVDYAKGVGDALGTGWNFRIYEDDEKAAQLISELSYNNFLRVEMAYNMMFERDLKNDCTNLINGSVKTDYAIGLSSKGII